MKKILLGTALLLAVSFTHQSAAAQTSVMRQGRADRNILSTQLPESLQATIKTDYNDYWITQCSENGKKKRQDYFVTLENADQTVQLRASDKSSWEVVSTTIKE